jgi:hypothetical protein
LKLALRRFVTAETFLGLGENDVAP